MYILILEMEDFAKFKVDINIKRGIMVFSEAFYYIPLNIFLLEIHLKVKFIRWERFSMPHVFICFTKHNLF